jgi:microcin C transport system permease protein
VHVILDFLVLAFILGAGFFLTTRAIPWVVIHGLRTLGFRVEASPVTLKRISRFKRIKRGYWSFLAIATLFVTSFFLELIVNGRPLVVHYEDRTAFPAVSEWAGKVIFFAPISFFEKASDFGQPGDSEVDYHRFARDSKDPSLLRAEIDDGRKAVAEERTQLAAAKGKSPGDRMRAASKKTALDRREEELAGLEKTYTVFAAGKAWCVMPLYPFGPSEFRHELAVAPPNKPSLGDGIPLGTDESGRDVLVLLAYGFRISLAFALVVAAIGYAFGTIFGAVQGYYGGWTDIIFQRLEEIWSAIPFLFLIMIIASLMTPTFLLLVGLMVVLVSWLGITMYMRAEFYREKAKDYVQAAIGCGVSDWKIMTRHILPNALVPLVTFAPFAVVGYIFSLVSLDYLGFGLPPGTPSWGDLLRQGLENVKFYPHLITIPTAALVLTLFAVVMIGEAVREAFDPKVFSRLR